VFISNSIIFFYSGTLATSLITREFLLATDTSQDVSAEGKESFVDNTASFVGALFMGLPLIYLSQYLLRGLWISVFYPFMEFLGFKKRTPGTAIFLNLCALRGGINLIMVLIVAQTPNSEIPINVKFFLSLWTTGFVLMTLLINAPAIPALLKACGLVQDSLIHLKMFEKAKVALKEFTFDAIKKLQRDPSLISADYSKIVKVVEEIFEESDTTTSTMPSARASVRSRHGHVAAEAGGVLTSPSSSVSICRRLDDGGRSTFYFDGFGGESITNLVEREGASIINIQRRSYELTKTERNVLPRRTDHLAGYSHLVTSVRAAGINTLKSETAKISRPDSLPGSTSKKSLFDSRGIVSDSWVELPETDRTGYTMEKFFKSFDEFKEQQDDACMQMNSSVSDNNSPNTTCDETELRVKFLAGMKRHCRQQRTKGKITSSELLWLEDACDRASHHKTSPLQMWHRLETKLWMKSTQNRHKTFSQLKKTQILFKYIYPLTVWWYFRGMKLGCICALTFLDALRSVGKYSWVRAFEWLDKEVQSEIQLVEEFLYHLRLDEPDLVQAVQSYRATRYLGTMMIGFVDRLHQSGLLEEHDVEKLDEPIKRILRNQSIALPSLPTLNDTIVKSLAFCKQLPPHAYQKIVLRSLKYKSLKRGEQIPQGVHIVLQGVVSSYRIHSESKTVMSLLGSGAVLGLTEVMTKCEKRHADKYAYSSLVHLAFLPEKSISKMKQISPESEKELYRCCAASVLDTWLRHTLAYESPGILDYGTSTGEQATTHIQRSSLSQSQTNNLDEEEEDTDLGAFVLKRLDRESLNSSLPRRRTPSSSRKTTPDRKRNLERDMQRVVEASNEDKKAELKRIAMHLLNSLDFTDVVILNGNDSITQQGHLVLLGGVVTHENGRTKKEYSDASVILYKKTRKKFVAQVKSYVIAFHPSI
jgi:hypothetical protein